MIIVANRIPVAEGWEDEFEDRFAHRAERVDERPGFVRMEVGRPIDADCYTVLTYWESREDFEVWVDSENFHDAHADRPPEEMFAGESQMEIHEVFVEAEVEPEPAD